LFRFVIYLFILFLFLYVFFSAGISRSPALAVAFVMRHLNLSSDDAYRYIKARRAHISPNFNFLGQLSEYERSLPSSTITTQSYSPLSLSSSIPMVKRITIEPPLNDRRRFLQVESSSCNSLKREHNNDQPKAPSRPQGFNFDLVNTRRPQSLISPSSAIATLSVESPQQHSSLPSKLLRPNSITLKRSSPTDEYSQTSELLNSSCNNETNSTTNKRVKTLPRSTDTSPLNEKNDLINTFFEGTTNLSKSSTRSDSTHSLDSATETTTTTANKSRTNSLNSSRELLVS
jgi:hypothetical protein